MTFLVEGATAVANYTPAFTANGAIYAAIIKTDGFPGNSGLMQISCIYAAGVTPPTADDFIVTVVASDVNNAAPLPDITEVVSISIQAVP